ncbi:unnamed protein product [Prorocentrum cordatum]|uniref:Importin subunit beta-1/Transportin-1-like TPR repeats domain-containing protein n=1 Tax=Prorocentrum cordatum TaxID=2364126 RepID=A0ABN9WNZ3_9DINO|nr:unnamed protein product [Polarella glacialis]
MGEHIQMLMLKAVRDPIRVIRHTAGTVITTMLEKLGVIACSQTLDQLAGFLSDGSADVVDGSFNALNKICEDGVSLLKQLWEAPAEYTEPFVTWSTQQLLPRVFEYASPRASVIARQNAIECLNHFALGWVLNDTERYAAFQPYAQRYVEALGILANDTDVVVLTHVCKGFVCIIENSWTCLAPQNAQAVVQYMLKASQHPAYEVRQEALEVWTPCTNSHEMLALIAPILPELVPVLLANMRFSNADYMGMEQAQIDDDNAEQPDQLEDIKPRFHKEDGDDDDDGQGQSGGAWGAEWTVRKAAASSLDHLANAFSAGILPIVLPLIQQRLEDPCWEVQESGVLALGAIAFGCMAGLVQFLPKVMELLLRLCRADKPLLRSISCWCCARFSSWFCQDQSCMDQAILREVLKALLERVLDKNKRVQEAACSAFATLEEEARLQLVPFLDDIVSTLARALQYYQAKNLLILYDAVGTLSEQVGQHLAKPQYIQALMGPLMAKFESVADNDRSIIPLFECLSALSQHLGEALLPVMPRLAQRCTRQVLEGAQASQRAQQNPNEFEKPDREVMAASIDLLAGIVEGLGERVQQVLAQHNFIMVAPEVLKDTSLQVKQSAFALCGDCAKNCIEYMKPFLPQVLPLCAASLRQNTSATVSNNAAWAIGEVCVRVGPEFMAPFLDDLMPALASVLTRQGMQYGQKQQLLTQNVCITIGRLGVVCGPQIAKGFGSFAQRWCLIMKHARLDHEKVNAFQGLCNMLRANPEAALGCVPALAGAIASFYPAPEFLQPSFAEILNSYKQQLGASWPEVYAQLPDDTKVRLGHMYNLGPS